MLFQGQGTGGESELHRRLKEQTFLWAYDRGFRCSAMEVRAPGSRFRVDVAAIRLDRRQSESTVAVFECKQSREDLDRDNRRHSELKAKLRALQERRDKLEQLLAVHYPSLRTSDSLFPEWATFDFSAIDHAAVQANDPEDCLHSASTVRKHEVRPDDPLQARESSLSGDDARVAC